MAKYLFSLILYVIFGSVINTSEAQELVQIFVVCGEQDASSQDLRCKLGEAFQSIYELDPDNNGTLAKPNDLAIWTFLPERIQLTIFTSNADAIAAMNVNVAEEAIVILDNSNGQAADFIADLEASSLESTSTSSSIMLFGANMGDVTICIPNVINGDFAALRKPPKICMPGIEDLQNLIIYGGGVATGIDTINR